MVDTEIQEAGGFIKPGDNWLNDQGYPALKDSDVSQAVNFLLMTDYSVHLSEIVSFIILTLTICISAFNLCSRLLDRQARSSE